MKNFIYPLLLLAFTGILSYHAYGDVTLEGQAGRKWGSINGKNYQANEYRVGGHGRFNDAPISFGISLGLTDFKNADFSENNGTITKKTDTAYGVDIAGEIKAWLPQTVTGPSWTPYARIAHTLYSDYQMSGNLTSGPDQRSYKIKGVSPGYTLAAGTSFRLTDHSRATVEYSFQRKKLNLTGGDDHLKGWTTTKGIMVGFNTTI